jgi:hypothetical protein
VGGALGASTEGCRRSRAPAARSASRATTNPLNLTDKEATKRGDQFIASELFLIALPRQADWPHVLRTPALA